MTTVDARVPINLAFSGVTGRSPAAGADVGRLVADSLPLELIPQFTDLVSNVHGRAAGNVAHARHAQASRRSSARSRSITAR